MLALAVRGQLYGQLQKHTQSARHCSSWHTNNEAACILYTGAAGLTSALYVGSSGAPLYSQNHVRVQVLKGTACFHDCSKKASFTGALTHIAIVALPLQG